MYVLVVYIEYDYVGISSRIKRTEPIIQTTQNKNSLNISSESRANILVMK